MSDLWPVGPQGEFVHVGMTSKVLATAVKPGLTLNLFGIGTKVEYVAVGHDTVTIAGRRLDGVNPHAVNVDPSQVFEVLP